MRHALFIPHSPVGPLTLAEEDGALTHLLFGICDVGASAQATPVLEQAERELNEYFAGRRHVFTVPLAPQGTPFQLRCWKALCEIPYGQTRSYAQQAAAAGSPKACRAAGMANHRNPISIIIPCHRVIGKNGSLTGYGGGLPVKEILLNLERMHAHETA